MAAAVSLSASLPRRRLLRLAAGLGVMAALGASAMPAFAADAASLRRTGKVGERADGLLALVSPGSDAALQADIDQINADRMALYRKGAAETGQALGTYQRVAAQKIISKLRPGEYFQDDSGAWKRK